MPYLLIDDGFADNAKITALSDRAFRLYVTSLVQSSRNLEDGEISRERLLFSASISKIARPKAVAKELVDAGLWVENGRGFLIHDYLKHNPSRAEIQEKREQARLRKKKYDASRNKPRNASPDASVTRNKTHPIEVLRTSSGASSPTGSPHRKKAVAAANQIAKTWNIPDSDAFATRLDELQAEHGVTLGALEREALWDIATKAISDQQEAA